MSKPENFVPGHSVKEDIEAVRNDTFSPFFIIGWNDDGTAYDFTGHSFELQVKEEREDGQDPVLTVPDSAFTITQDSVGSAQGVNNKVTILYGASNMDIEPGDYVYDIEMTDASGETYTIYQEDKFFRVKQDVTQ